MIGSPSERLLEHYPEIEIFMDRVKMYTGTEWQEIAQMFIKAVCQAKTAEEIAEEIHYHLLQETYTVNTLLAYITNLNGFLGRIFLLLDALDNKLLAPVLVDKKGTDIPFLSGVEISSTKYEEYMAASPLSRRRLLEEMYIQELVRCQDRVNKLYGTNLQNKKKRTQEG